jgi:hypothetical protein
LMTLITNLKIDTAIISRVLEELKYWKNYGLLMVW